MQLFFYDVNVDYVNYLKKAEISKRGFTKVPDIEYNNKKKMLCGIVLQINEYKYYVPISSYKKQQSNNILIKLEADAYSQIKGSLRFNYMFPVPDKYVTKCNFSKSNTTGRKEFLRRQWVYCNTIADDITKMANKTYSQNFYLGTKIQGYPFEHPWIFYLFGFKEFISLRLLRYG